MTWIFVSLTAIYSAFLLFLAKGSAAIIRQDKTKADPEEHSSISIVIAARNELHNLPNLLGSLARLDYPPELFEIIVVNDHSIDGSREYLNTQTICPGMKVIHLYHDTAPLVGKKAALQQGIDAARHDILAFTDADCLVPSTWLSEINRSMDRETDYLLSYSVMKCSPEGTEFRLKNFERSIYYALASAGLYFHIPFTSSACNMVYRKSLFMKSGGFDTIAQLRSGDDDLLLMKMMPYIRKAAYNPRSTMQVVSLDGNDLAAHHHTNIRRASKFRYYPLWLKGLALFVFAYFILFYLAIVNLAIAGFSYLLLGSLLIKTLAELILSARHLVSIGKAKLSLLYPVQLLVFPAQFIFYALRGSFGKYRWK